MTDHALTARAAPPPLNSPLPVVVAGLLAAVVLGLALAVNPALGISGLILLLYAPVAFLDLGLGAVLWVPFAFLERLSVLGLASTALLLVFATAWLGALPLRAKMVAGIFRAHAGLFATLALLVLWIGLSLLWAGDVGAAGHAVGSWARAAAIFAVIATTITTERYLTLTCFAFVIGAVLSVLAGLIPGASASFEAAPDEMARFSGVLGDPNYLAAGLVPAIAIGAALVGTKAASGVARLALMLGIGVLAVGVAASGSRGGLIAAGVAVAAALVLARGRRLRLGALVALLVAATGLWLVTASPQTWERVRDFDTDTGREDLWDIAWRMSEDNLAIGVGANNFEDESRRYFREPGQINQPDLIVTDPHVAHNVYLQQLAETGIVGLALLLGAVAAALRASWLAASRFDDAGRRRMAGLARGILVAQISALSASIFLSNGSDTRLWVLLALGPALATVAAGRRPAS